MHKEEEIMNRQLNKPNYPVLIRLLTVLVSAVGLNPAVATSAHAAGNVELRLEHGNAVITGDEGDNNIIVIQACCQTVIVTGRAETTVNGNTGRSGVEGVCNAEDSEFLNPERARFDGGAPSGFPGDGFVAPAIEFTHINNFEDFPDDCSFLGGRD